MATTKTTPFSIIQDSFLSKITEDMQMELDELDTYKLLEELLLSAVHFFEFPRFDITDYELNYVEDEGVYSGVESDYEEVRYILLSGGYFNAELTQEEINIIATYMVVEWLGQQLASVENIRMKFSSSDFKLTSQASHMSKIQTMKSEYERLGFHLQRLQGRRKKDSSSGLLKSTFGSIMEGDS